MTAPDPNTPPVEPITTAPEPTPTPDKGFPDATPIAEMTVEQQAAYWKFQSRKHEGVANQYRAFGDPDTVKSLKEAADAAELARLNPSEQAVIAAREEGRVAALAEANSTAALAILRSSLEARGKTADEVNTFIGAFNPAAFIADGSVQTDQIAQFVTSLVGPPAGNPNAWPATGQGSFQRAAATGVSAGRALYQAEKEKRRA